MTSTLPEGRNVDIPRVLREARLGTLHWLAEERAPYEDEFRGAADELFHLLQEREIEFVLVGGLAVLQWVEGRNTIDIDIVMSPQDLGRLPELTVLSRDSDFVRASFHGVVVDVLLTRNPVFDLVRERYAVRSQFREHTLPCATPEGIVLMKLYALPSLYRQGQFDHVRVYETDVARLVRAMSVDPEPLVNLLAPYLLASDVAEIRRIVSGIRRMIAEFEDERFGPPSTDDPKPA